MAGSVEHGTRARRARVAALALALGVPSLALTTAGPGPVAGAAEPVEETTVTTTFHATGIEQVYVVPAGISQVRVEAVGAAGDPATGRGYRVAGVVDVRNVPTLFVHVGEPPNGREPGFGGGGRGGHAGGLGAEHGTAGGGASDVRTCSAIGRPGSTSCHQGTLGSRRVVAGGGGGRGGAPNTSEPRPAAEAGGFGAGFFGAGRPGDAGSFVSVLGFYMRGGGGGGGGGGWYGGGGGAGGDSCCFGGHGGAGSSWPSNGSMTSEPARVSITYDKLPTSLATSAPGPVDYHDRVAFSARLTVLGQPLGGKPLTFTWGPLACTGITDANGDTACTMRNTLEPGTYPYSVRFAGDSVHLSSRSAPVDVVSRPEDTVITYDGPTTFGLAQPASPSATLVEGDPPAPGDTLAGRTVTFRIGQQSCDGLTDASGRATCSIPLLTHLPGPATVTASFAGSVGYAPSSTSAAVTVGCLPGDTIVCGLLPPLRL